MSISENILNKNPILSKNLVSGSSFLKTNPFANNNIDSKTQYRGRLGLGRWSILVNNGLWRPRNFDIEIIRLLQWALQGKVSRILLSVPSRHGKSSLISKNFASYFLAHYPNDKVILTAYSQGLASEFGGQVKDIINYYGNLSPYNVKLSTDSRAKNKFNIRKPYQGQMLAVGSAGSVMGFGAGLFIVDDPIKNVADAESEVKQQKLKDWFQGVVKSRLERRTNGKPPIVIVIAQRLHLNDLHGIIKSTEPTIDAITAYDIIKKGGIIPQDTWVDLNIPAICVEPEKDILHRGLHEVLWEEQRDYEWLMSEKKAMGSYLFNAIYQGMPIERDGHIFKREWFMDETTNKIYNQISLDEVPDAPLLRYWDFGASGKKGDATAGMLSAWTGDELIFINLVTGKFTARQTLSRFKRTAKKDGKNVIIRIEQEPGSASKILIDKFRRSKEFKGYNVRGDKVKYKKNVRSFDLEALAEDGAIWFVKGDWNIEVIDHLVAFTGEEGKPDDIADACTGSARYWRRPKRRVNA